MMDELMGVEDENGRKLRDEEIINVLLMYLNAGHESSAHVTIWATVLLHQHPDCLCNARNMTPKAGTFLPFGAGSHMCPGNDLAKIEIAAFLHYFLVGYE
ncbi:unnamed protein product [Linum tenue]|uniref:Cytochrome P450 n=1 Tax=Linum tenue TaxID=586396 RepID=A0AAV0KCR6_9ROSI|nr:unnamed protein product [Linum tenue]